jgi:hypothetical protein
MAINTLKGIKSIDGFEVVTMDELREQYPEKFNESGAMDYKWFESEIRPNRFIYVRHDVNSISFTLQNGPVKENGVNGCQVDTIIATAKAILQGLNEQHSCTLNEMAIDKLDWALQLLSARKKERELRGVEGKNEA